MMAISVLENPYTKGINETIGIDMMLGFWTSKGCSSPTTRCLFLNVCSHITTLELTNIKTFRNVFSCILELTTDMNVLVKENALVVFRDVWKKFNDVNKEEATTMTTHMYEVLFTTDFFVRREGLRDLTVILSKLKEHNTLFSFSVVPYLMSICSCLTNSVEDLEIKERVVSVLSMCVDHCNELVLNSVVDLFDSTFKAISSLNLKGNEILFRRVLVAYSKIAKTHAEIVEKRMQKNLFINKKLRKLLVGELKEVSENYENALSTKLSIIDPLIIQMGDINYRQEKLRRLAIETYSRLCKTIPLYMHKFFPVYMELLIRLITPGNPVKVRATALQAIPNAYLSMWYYELQTYPREFAVIDAMKVLREIFVELVGQSTDENEKVRVAVCRSMEKCVKLTGERLMDEEIVEMVSEGICNILKTTIKKTSQILSNRRQFFLPITDCIKVQNIGEITNCLGNICDLMVTNKQPMFYENLQKIIDVVNDIPLTITCEVAVFICQLNTILTKKSKTPQYTKDAFSWGIYVMKNSKQSADILKVLLNLKTLLVDQNTDFDMDEVLYSLMEHENKDVRDTSVLTYSILIDRKNKFITKASVMKWAKQLPIEKYSQTLIKVFFNMLPKRIIDITRDIKRIGIAICSKKSYSKNWKMGLDNLNLVYQYITEWCDEIKLLKKKSTSEQLSLEDLKYISETEDLICGIPFY
ncbi:hypothetical protein EIN_185150 [Entamoeba invadens IP1]|uniref:hypothetical protein n=1 Tax=Entamoeba invadens IP1 TaxID=370355 RepID=UPI0002C3E92C|nr:hypothetical protein EIN_185150 [Entamoeba invadens IP1]ELP94138.1 hypothetical protein EIN_185150 [Entamoeba invadens IP1]|eukprot:XP_004260909.1 hypothetical protein EIN_185150 [Entamoeba invadens IP1]